MAEQDKKTDKPVLSAQMVLLYAKICKAMENFGRLQVKTESDRKFFDIKMEIGYDEKTTGSTYTINGDTGNQLRAWMHKVAGAEALNAEIFWDLATSFIDLVVPF